MERFNYLRTEEISKVPKTTGVYAFLGKPRSRFSTSRRSRDKTAKPVENSLRGKGGFLYIGKALNLRERVRSYFQQPDYRAGFFISQVSKIGYIETSSEIEALILEANLIKKEQPKYNVLWRDDKNFFYVGITKEALPRIFITHQIKNLKSVLIGPFIEGAALKKTLRTLRGVFPYYTAKTHPKGPCPWCHLLLCPGPDPDRSNYQKSIKNLISVLKGKRKSTLIKLKQEMKKAVFSRDYEGAAKIRDRIAALEKVMSHAKVFTGPERRPEKQKELEKKLKKILKTEKPISRIEAYDVSNIQGQLATGAMVTFINGIPDKNFYRKFKVKLAGKPNDIAMLKEILSRRFKHPEWEFPDLILIDGGIAQLNAALKVLSRHKSVKSALIGVLALAKKENKLFIEGRKKPILLKGLPREIFNLILQLRDEAHRFAISYHKKLREIDLKRSF